MQTQERMQSACQEKLSANQSSKSIFGIQLGRRTNSVRRQTGTVVRFCAHRFSEIAMILAVLAVLLGVLVLTGCDQTRRGRVGPPVATIEIDTVRWTGFSAPADLAITGALRAMTAEQVASQMIIVDVATVLAHPSLQPGAVVLFSDDFGSVAATVALTSRLHDAAGIPPFVATDVEGGTVDRLFSSGLPATRIPAASRVARSLAAKDDEEAARMAEALGRVIGTELRALGISMDFAPVADLAAPGSRGAIGAYYRSYGTDPERVATIVGSMVRGMQASGVASVTKHFPGHGVATGDSHDGVAVLDRTLAQLRASELVPFRAVVEEDVAGIMTAHVTVPGLTSTSIPATLSAEIMVDLLRREVGHVGLVVTDALNMGALANGVGGISYQGQAAVESICAGADMILLPSDTCVVRDAIVDAIGRGTLSRTQVAESIRRILEAKIRFAVAGPGHQTTVGEAAEVLGSADHRAISRSLGGGTEE